ncbi:hypothetical protein PGTUg99_034706 [Puccinia graminis f. sp. tritici]|uniref:Uncharacterized protein n=1 Tax=Puccinia graminis f. sp. tritici TaxID=56615 RepID=A0A5B0SMF2_PUCGR|nr:hypothetical protein PGTUg99_034706 [Puccinia graminis f. sp. tritici]
MTSSCLICSQQLPMSFIPTPTPITQTPSADNSVVEFAKYMMGCTASNFQLPPEPTIQEVRSREKFALADRAFYGIQHENTQAPLLPDYCQSGLRSHSKFTLDDKNRCDLQFHSKGFPRITFEWKKPNWTDSDWNSCTADILCDNWGIWVLNERKISTFSFLETKAALQEWLVSKNADLSRTRKEMEEGQEIVDHNSEHKEALSVFPDHPKLLALFKDADTVSDYDESEDITVLPTRIIPSWRSAVLTSVVRAIDLATVQLASKEKKTALMRWFSRGDERRPTEDEVIYERIPSGLPFDAYSRDFIEQTSILEHHQMRISKRDQGFSLDAVLDHLNNVTKK